MGNAWWDEKKEYSINDVSKVSFSSGTGHFTQMAWATSTEIGCGYALFEEGKWKSKEIVVCNYIVAGNFQGREIYKSGKPCSECENGKSCNEDYPGLCGGDGIYSDGNDPNPNSKTKTNPDGNSDMVDKDS